MKYYIFCSTASSNTTDLTRTHARTRTHTCKIAVWAWERNVKDLEVGRIFDNIRCMSGNATSAESKNGFMCTIPTNILTHLTVDKSRRQVHTAVDHARYEVSYRTARTPHIDSPHPQSYLCTRLLYVAVNKRKRLSSTQLCARPTLSSNGTSRCSVVFRRMSTAFTWERGCLWTVVDQCRHDSIGVHTNPRRSLIFMACPSVLLCVTAIPFKKCPNGNSPYMTGL